MDSEADDGPVVSRTVETDVGLMVSRTKEANDGLTCETRFSRTLFGLIGHHLSSGLEAKSWLTRLSYIQRRLTKRAI